MSAARNAQRGVTLIELVVSIVIIAIAVGAVLGLFSLTTKQSADVMVREQAVAIGEAYLEEILLKPFKDPDGVDGETQRVDFDDVDDYNGLDDVGARNQFLNASDDPISGLESYNVGVRVTQGSLNGLPGGATLRVDVTVTHPAAGVTVRLSGYRTDY